MARKRLTASQERDLVIAAECGDSEACRQLVEAFMPAIGNLARGFTGATIERGELVQEGVAALLFAARRYDPALETPFWTYAAFWVRKAMQELVAELARPVALSDRAVRDLAGMRAARRRHVEEHGREPTSEELGRATGLTLEQLESLQASERRPRSTQEPVGVDGASGLTVGDTIVDPAAEHSYQRLLDELEIQSVRDLTDELDDRERTVIRAHYGLGTDAQTLSQIGAALGLTAERARQIESAALDKLRAMLTQPAPVGDTAA